jgi:hypothetical protein
MSWQAIAERAARRRGDAILAKFKAAIAQSAPGATVERDSDGMRVRGRGLKQRWLSEPRLRFARRLEP